LEFRERGPVAAEQEKTIEGKSIKDKVFRGQRGWRHDERRGGFFGRRIASGIEKTKKKISNKKKREILSDELRRSGRTRHHLSKGEGGKIEAGAGEGGKVRSSIR